MGEIKTIQQQLDEIGTIICDKYCRYRIFIPEGKTEDWLLEDEDSPCNTCPLVTSKCGNLIAVHITRTEDDLMRLL